MLLRALLFCLLLVAPTLAQDNPLERALSDALDTFEAARPALGTHPAGVDVGAYRDALSLQRFASTLWGGPVRVELVEASDTSGDCARFAAYTRLPPEAGAVRLVLCPKFFTPGAEGLRALTILHEMVHVVAGPDECRAMAFAARIEVAARGAFTPVDGYWAENGCDGSGFSLPQ